jgi:glucarate dehydratase
MKGTTRTIVKVHTDEGITGLGETMGDSKGAIDTSVTPMVVGSDPFDIERMTIKQLGTWGANTRSWLIPFSGVELALWDIMGKVACRPVCDLIGGMFRKEVEFTAYIYPRYRGKEGIGGETTPSEISKWSSDLLDEYGFRTFECKIGVLSPRHDVEQVKAMRETLGEDVILRVDPNRVWCPHTAIRNIKAMEPYINNIEEPCRGIEAMARVRKAVNVPMSSHTVSLLPEIVRLGAADAFCAVPPILGGISETKKFAAATELFNLSFWLESSGELGISLAAHLHISGSTPHMIHANQGHTNQLVDDVIVGGKFNLEKGGYIQVPQKPGLGVELDEDKVKKFAQLFKNEGPYIGSIDCNRPGWHAMAPMY